VARKVWQLIAVAILALAHPGAAYTRHRCARQRPRPEFLRLSDRGAEQRNFAIIRDTGGLDISVQILFQFVMARHFVYLAAFLTAAPPAFFLRKVVLDRERDDGPNAAKVYVITARMHNHGDPRLLKHPCL
jgi:hypothetical protein